MVSFHLAHLSLRCLPHALWQVSLSTFLFGETGALFRQGCELEGRPIILQDLILLAMMPLDLFSGVCVGCAQVWCTGLVWYVLRLTYLSSLISEFPIVRLVVYSYINLRWIGQVNLLTDQIGVHRLLWHRQVLVLLYLIEFELKLRWFIVITLLDTLLWQSVRIILLNLLYGL